MRVLRLAEGKALPVEPGLGADAILAKIAADFLVGFTPGDVHPLLTQAGPHASTQDERLVRGRKAAEGAAVFLRAPSRGGAASQGENQQKSGG